MKLYGSAMVAVAMMLGALATTGCSKLSAATDGAIAPEENPATAAVVDNIRVGVNVGVEQDWRPVHYYAPYGPPAARYERPGYAPSARHFWAPGYYRWTGRDYSWYGGRWYERRPGYEYSPGHWENRYGRWEYIPGYWGRRY